MLCAGHVVQSSTANWDKVSFCACFPVQGTVLCNWEVCFKALSGSVRLGSASMVQSSIIGIALLDWDILFGSLVVK